MADLRLGENIVIPAIVVGGEEIKNQDKTITENGRYSADAGYTGLGTITVAVPSVEPTGTISITQNGVYDVAQYANADVNVPTGDIPSYVPPKEIVNGVLKNPDTATSYSTAPATDVGQYALAYAFYRRTNLTSADLSSLTMVSGIYGMYYCFDYCTNLTSVDLSSLTTVIDNYGMDYCFANCTNLTSVDFPSLIRISGTMRGCFGSCTKLTSVGLSSLATISGSYAMQYCFSGCSNLTSVGLSSLTTISGSNAMQLCFQNCAKLTELRFPSLQSFGTSTSTVNQFNNMVSGVTGCTLHFPSNMQSEVERRTGYPNFGGANTVVLFDLPPTA